jgi:hypothetical protein
MFESRLPLRIGLLMSIGLLGSMDAASQSKEPQNKNYSTIYRCYMRLWTLLHQLQLTY